MAYISQTAFEPFVTNHEYDSTANITGVFAPTGNLVTATTDVTSGTVSVTAATFMAKVANVTGIYVFIATVASGSTTWALNGDAVTLADYGVTLSAGTAASDDKITVTYTGADASGYCSSGFLCIRSTNLNNEGYANIPNANAYTMVATGTISGAYNEPIYACNTFNVNQVVDPITKQRYKVGANTLGLPLPPGDTGTFTRVYFNNVNEYHFGIGNLNGAIGNNTYLTIAAGLMVPTGSAPSTAGQPYFKLLYEKPFTEGTQNAFDGYVLRACRA